MKPIIQNILGIALMVCALALTGSIVHREVVATRTTSAAQEVRIVKDWHALITDGRAVGPPEAVLRVVAFSDYQCPYCRTVEPLLNDLRERFGGRLAVVYRHFPIVTAHAQALAAANAAECAAVQNRFSEYHDALFANADSVDLARWSSIARLAGVSDMERFERCVRNEEFRGRVERDAALGRKIGVSGTPTFVFRDRMVSGSNGLYRISLWLDSAVAILP